MLNVFLYRRIVAKAKQHLRSLKSQKWLMNFIKGVIIYIIKNHLNDIITWFKHILENLFNF